MIYDARKLLDDRGYTKTESILNEWNYVKEWIGAEYAASKKAIKGLKGAAFSAATMCVSHNAPLDMLMYYDARPCGWNGMFNTDFVYEPLKGYFPFWMYNKLYLQDYSVFSESLDKTVYAAAAGSENGNGAVMVTYFDDDAKEKNKIVEIAFNGIKGEKTLEFYLLDEDNDATLVKTEQINNEISNIQLEMSLYSTYLIQIKDDELEK